MRHRCDGWHTWSGGWRTCRFCLHLPGGSTNQVLMKTCWQASPPSLWSRRSGPGRSPSALYMSWCATSSPPGQMRPSSAHVTRPQVATLCSRCSCSMPLVPLGCGQVDIDADAVADLAPERVSQLVLDRLRRLSPETIRVAEQVAVLGTHAEVRHVRALSMLAEHQVLVATDELAAAGLLRPGQPLEFVHPVVRSSVYESVAAGRRAGDHGRAARLLGEERAAPARVAMHLLKAPAAGDAWAVEMLREAASAEIRPETRATYLRRAVVEPAPASVQAELLIELGRAESLTFDPRALDHLKEALRLSEDTDSRATAAGLLVHSYFDHDRPSEAEPVLRAAIAQLSGTEPTAAGPKLKPLVTLHVLSLELDHRASRMSPQRLSEAIAMAGDGP